MSPRFNRRENFGEKDPEGSPVLVEIPMFNVLFHGANRMPHMLRRSGDITTEGIGEESRRK